MNSVKLKDKKINIQKLVAILYTNKEISERERKQFHLQLHRKILRNKFNKGGECKVDS